MIFICVTEYLDVLEVITDKLEIIRLSIIGVVDQGQQLLFVKSPIGGRTMVVLKPLVSEMP